MKQQIAQQVYVRPRYQSPSGKRQLVHPDDINSEDDDSLYETRLRTSARRLNVSPEKVYQQGNNRLHVRVVGVPPRASRPPQLPSPSRDTEDFEEEPHAGRRRVHPLVWVGLSLFTMVIGWIAFNALGAWIQAKQDDLTYGQMRHFEVNAVVGHSDSDTSPSHFTAENNNGSIFVIELPGGNTTKAKIYPITMIPNNDGNPPVRVSFQDVNHDGKPDMVVQIGDNQAVLTIVLYNNGQTFVPRL